MLPPGLNPAASVLEDTLAAALWTCSSEEKKLKQFGIVAVVGSEETYQEDLWDVLISPHLPC